MADRRLQERGITLWLVGMSPSVQSMVLRSPLGQAMEQRLFLNLEQALVHYLQHLAAPQIAQ
ncbi:hypothetical protein D3C86_2055060 [compost metagenome]